MILTILFIFFILLLVAWVAASAMKGRLISAVNTGINGIHDAGLLPRFATAPIAEKYLLVKKGADQNTVQVCTAITDLSQGVCTDEAKFSGDPINVASHAGADGTRLVRINVPVTQDDELIPAVNGRAGKLAGSAAGTYYPFGRVITPGAAGDVIEYAPFPTIPRVMP